MKNPVWYGIVDTAQDPRLYDAVVQAPHHASLFSGELHPALAKAAPYLVDLDTAPALAASWRSEGWGRNWGVVCRSSRSLDDLRRHFARFLVSALPDGSSALFRFYDPRVLRAYLPTADGAALARWFDGIDEIVVVAADGVGSHQLALRNGRLAAHPPLAGG